jgi:hypothetical protein
MRFGKAEKDLSEGNIDLRDVLAAGPRRLFYGSSSDQAMNIRFHGEM